MKKILTLVILFACLSFAQERFKTLDFGTVVTATPESQYLDLTGWSAIDSISIVAIGTGEVDVDSLDIYGAYMHPTDGTWVDVTILGTATVTLNLADGVEDVELLVASNATILTGAALRGLNGLKVTVQPAAGSDATDPNRILVGFQIWGTGY
ncbi:MAG: hypothetical protein GY804_09830 [Alphaproteobacteria bacterium]|nr:hypothetical protein [Alphaproteobacteria bacterium]